MTESQLIRILNNARERQDMSISEVARRSGLSRCGTSDYLAGKRGITVGTLLRLAPALRLRVVVDSMPHSLPEVDTLG